MKNTMVAICLNGQCGECYKCRLDELTRENVELWRRIYRYQLQLARALDKLDECANALRTIIKPVGVFVYKDGDHYGIADWDGKSVSACHPELPEDVAVRLAIALAAAIEAGESEADIVGSDGCTYSAVLVERMVDAN